MKRTLNSDRKKGGVKWDENNLEENEKIKAELNPIKITEPKTPYLSPMDTDDELDLEAGMSPLSLEDDGPSAKRSNGSWSADSEKGSSPQSRGSGGGSGSGGSPHWERRSPRFNDYYRDDSDTADAGSDAAEQAEKRRKFMELRRKHYNMKEALKKKEEKEVPDGEQAEDAGADADVEDSEGTGGAAANGQQHPEAAAGQAGEDSSA